jgi:hypothetical protein
MRPQLVTVLALLSSIPAAAQTTWYVDGAACDSSGIGTDSDPFCTIQEAIDAASSGDVILVQRGIYQENLHVPSIVLEIRGEQGAERTIVVGTPAEEWRTLPAIRVPAGTTLTLDGLSIRRGKPGILCDSAVISARNCRWSENVGKDPYPEGGALWAAGSDVTVDQCSFDSNTGDYGGALFLLGGHAELRDSTFSANCAPEGGSILIRGGTLEASGCRFEAETCKSIRGGAIYSSGAQIFLDSCSFREFLSGEAHGLVMWAEDSVLDVRSTVVADNDSSQGWGAINLEGCTSAFQQCRFERNRSSVGQLEGGAFYIHGDLDDRSVFVDCVFRDNWSAEGGAAWIDGAAAEFDRCFFRGNRAFSFDQYGNGNGGAVSGRNADLRLNRCVFIDNRAGGSAYAGAGRGGAVSGPAVLQNCTLFRNAAETYGGGRAGEGGGAYDCTLNSCIVWRNTPDSLSGPAVADWSDIDGGWPGSGNFDSDPLFWGPAHGDFDLLAGSPCIDSGDPTQTDADGSRLDVGAFAFEAEYCGNPGTYCRAKENSRGCLPAIDWSGLPALSGPGHFHVLASRVLPHELGMLVWSVGGAAEVPFLGGTLCVAPPLHRFDMDRSSSGGDCEGTFDFRISKGFLHSHGLEAGTRLYFQIWYRDPRHADGTGAGLTDALEATLCLGH